MLSTLCCRPYLVRFTPFLKENFVNFQKNYIITKLKLYLIYNLNSIISLMKVIDRINEILKEKNISKKELARRLIDLDMKAAKTGEVPSVSSIYAYLNGNIELKADFIPFIAEALGVFEQELFSPSSQNAQKIIEKLYKRQLNLHRYYNILENLEHLTPKTLEILEKIANENKSKLKEFNEFSRR